MWLLQPLLYRANIERRVRWKAQTNSTHKNADRRERVLMMIAEGRVGVKFKRSIAPMVAPLLISKTLRHLPMNNKFAATIVRMVYRGSAQGFAPFITFNQWNAIVKIAERKRASHE